MAVEVEMRARFDEATWLALADWLAAVAEDFGSDDKKIYFYVLPDKVTKVVDNISQDSAKVTLKAERIGRGAAFPEIEVPIAQQDVPDAVRLLDALGLAGARHEAFNRRHNYRYRGVDVALKWSEAWGYHAEFELLLDADDADDEQVAAAKSRIGQVAAELGVRLMNEQELFEFTRQFEDSLDRE